MSVACDVATEVGSQAGPGCSEQEGVGGEEALEYLPLPAGEYVIVVDGFSERDAGEFELFALLTPEV